MNLERNIHSKAMEFMMFAKMGKAKGLPEREIKDAYFTAFLLEKKAIERAASDDDFTKFILMRSAATLAYNADLLEESKILVAKCKSENPPTWIIEQLDEILAQITIKESTAEDKIPILIPSNRLTDIVKTFWSQKVQILVRKTVTGLMILEDIKIAA